MDPVATACLPLGMAVALLVAASTDTNTVTTPTDTDTARAREKKAGVCTVELLGLGPVVVVALQKEWSCLSVLPTDRPVDRSAKKVLLAHCTA